MEFEQTQQDIIQEIKAKFQESKVTALKTFGEIFDIPPIFLQAALRLLLAGDYPKPSFRELPGYIERYDEKENRFSHFVSQFGGDIDRVSIITIFSRINRQLTSFTVTLARIYIQEVLEQYDPQMDLERSFLLMQV